MKTALVTMALTPDRELMGDDLTFPQMRYYAERCGMDFILINEVWRDRALGDMWDWERNDNLFRLLTEYDRVLHLEDDVIVCDSTVDVSVLPLGTFYGFDNAPFNPPEVMRCQHQADLTWAKYARKGMMRHLFNTGMFVCDQSHRELFAPVSPEPCNVNSDQSKPSHWKGQGLLAQRMHYYGTSVEHRPDLFGFSYLKPDPMPSFIHVLWDNQPKYKAVRECLRQVKEKRWYPH